MHQFFPVCVCVCMCDFFLDSSHCVALSVRGLSMYTKLVSDLKRYICLCLVNIGIKVMCQISVRILFSSTVDTNLSCINNFRMKKIREELSTLTPSKDT